MGASSGDGRFDYVVVGAGSAGCVLAGRLTEDPDVRVLLLEAGGSDDLLEVRMPAVPYRLFKTEHDWNYATAPEAELAGRRLYWPRGKLIGGSSSINAMLYVRGNRLDYDSWRDDYGCRGWGYDDLLPYFLRSEDQARGADAFHAVGGPLRVEDPREPHVVAQAWIEAAIAAGITENRDFNARIQDGAPATDRLARRRTTSATAGSSPHRPRAESRAPIGVQHDSPDVGGWLQDHPIVPMQWYTRGVLDLYSEETERNEQQWQRDQTGPMTSSTAESNPLRPYLAEECLPGAVDTPTLLAHYLQSIYHPTSSVAMGPNDDDPLDLELRVRGIDRLRLVDALAMPAIPRGNTNAPTIALAERAVDLIRGTAAQRQQHTEQIAEFAGGAL
jgi:choline dehydrogenase-like flavoprotein